MILPRCFALISDAERVREREMRRRESEIVIEGETERVKWRERVRLRVRVRVRVVRGRVREGPTAERRGNNLKGFEDVHLKATARFQS